MIINCDKCSATLQFDDAKMPSGNFSVRCPRCQNMISVNSKTASPSSAPASVPQKTPSQSNIPVPEISKPAPMFRAGNGNLSEPLSAANAKNPAADGSDSLQVLANLLQRGFSKNAGGDDHDGEFAQVLLCLNAELRESVSRQLADAGYRVYLAETPTQALERMRDSEMMVVIFSSNFAPEYSGAALIQQQVQSMVALDRRRVFLISLEENVQTFNTHEAFIRNFNLVVNMADAHNLPIILNRALRDFRELYRYYLKALRQNYA
jgi:predicted Zn finger-like uncharacterized protein